MSVEWKTVNLNQTWKEQTCIKSKECDKVQIHNYLEEIVGVYTSLEYNYLFAYFFFYSLHFHTIICIFYSINKKSLIVPVALCEENTKK